MTSHEGSVWGSRSTVWGSRSTECGAHYSPVAYTHFLMLSTSLEIVSSSLMEEKSLPKPPTSSAAMLLAVPVNVGFDHAVDTFAKLVATVTLIPASLVEDASNEAVFLHLRGPAGTDDPTLCVGVSKGELVCDWGLRSDGGIMAGVSSLGTSFPRTFSAMRNIARAN